MSNRRAQLLRELAELDAATTEGEVDLTVCMIFGNAWRIINPVLEALPLQGVRMNVMACMDATSNDPTRSILKECVTYMPSYPSGAINTFMYMGDFPKTEGLDNMKAHAYRACLMDANTEWVLLLDSDVLLDPGTLRKLCNIAKEGKGIGAWTVRYNHKVDHVQWGCTLMRRRVALDVGFNGRDACGCANLANDLREKGLKMVYVDGLSASHLNRGQIRTVVIGE